MMCARPFLDATSAWFTAGLLLASLWGSAGADVAHDAVATVSELHAGLLAAAERRGTPFATRYDELSPLIMATHDLDYIGEITLRRQWAGLNKAQQADFRARFRRLAVANYVDRFAGLQNASFNIEGDEVLPRGRHQVSATLAPATGEPVTLTYVLHQGGDDGWKIINVVANQVSDLALTRAEYQRILRDSDFAGLLEHLDNQAQRLAGP